MGGPSPVSPESNPFPMVAAVHFFAMPEDETLLLDYILASNTVRLFPWEAMDINNPILLGPGELPPQSAAQQRYGIVDQTLGSICFIGERPARLTSDRASSFVFDQMNWDNSSPSAGQGIVDWNRTPALFWDRGTVTADGELGVGNIGSQADAMDDISADYRKWVNRVMNWVKRKGVKVAQNGTLTPEAQGLNVRIGFLNAVFALPGAMAFFHSGGSSERWA